MSTKPRENVVSVPRAKPEKVADFILGWIGSAMEVNKFLEPGYNIA
jgi:hypothetical protein